ncbi:MAG: ChbG/HpnK family deacetylase [Flavobacteriales bacterium]|nr:ChbG/HpnK family deacetylase [Flavobacteriales bacterium]
MKKLIVTADDYGVFPSIDKGIISAVLANKVNSVAAFTNYKDSVANTLHLLEVTNGEVEVGCHLTITSGKPITNDKAKSLCKNGYFRQFNEFRREMDPAGLKSELNAQIKVFQDANIKLHHLTCHHNSLSLFPEYFEVYLEVARKHKLPIRSNNIHPPQHHSMYLQVLCYMLLDDLKLKDRKEIVTFGQEINTYFAKQANGVKSPDILESRHYGPIPMFSITKGQIAKKVRKKHSALDALFKSYVESNTYSSMELMLHLAQDEIPGFNEYEEIDYPGINRRYFDSRIVEFKSIMNYDLAKAEVEMISWSAL